MAMDVRSQACSYLRDGRVRVFVARPGGDDDKPLAVRAYVYGWSRRHFVRLNYGGAWLCSCTARGDACPHIAAVKLVTGYGGPASPPRGKALAEAGER
jgi:hypothetical protein